MNRDAQLNDKAWRLLGDIELLIKLDHCGLISVSQFKREIRQNTYIGNKEYAYMTFNDVRNHIIEVKWNMFRNYEPLRDVDTVEDIRETLIKKEKELYDILPKVKEAMNRASGILYKRLEEASKLAFDHKSTREWVEKYGK